MPRDPMPTYLIPFLAKHCPRELKVAARRIQSFRIKHARTQLVQITHPKRLGEFDPYTREVRINRVLFMDLPGAHEQMIDTLVHEFAHLCQYHEGGENHDRVWRRWMVLFGRIPSVQCNLGNAPAVSQMMETQPNIRRLKVVGHCERCGEKIIRRRALAKNKQYEHIADCGGVIVPKTKEN